MPRYPDASTTVTGIRGSVFSALARGIAEHRGEVYPFHVGDTWLEPAVGCRIRSGWPHPSSIWMKTRAA